MVSGELLWTDDVVTDLLEKASGDLQIRISLPSTRCWGSKQSNTVFLHPYPIDPMFDIFGHLLTPSFGCFTPLWHGLYGLISWCFPKMSTSTELFPRPRSCSKCSSHPTRDPPGSSLGRWSHEERHLEVTQPAGCRGIVWRMRSTSLMFEYVGLPKWNSTWKWKLYDVRCHICTAWWTAPSYFARTKL